MQPTPSFRSDIDLLRAMATPRTASFRLAPFGLSALDGSLGGELRAGALHEAAAAASSPNDEAVAALFLAGVAARESRMTGAPVLWVGCRSDLYAPGLAQAGLSAADVIYAESRDNAGVLAVVEDAVRDGTPCAVVAEASRVGMVATRRLQLAAADADMPVLLLRRRRGRADDPLAEPSAAWSRWRIGCAPSGRVDVPGVGRARWRVELARRRGGEPFSTVLEACDETGRLAVPGAPVRRADPSAGAVRLAAA